VWYQEVPVFTDSSDTIDVPRGQEREDAEGDGFGQPEEC